MDQGKDNIYDTAFAIIFNILFLTWLSSIKIIASKGKGALPSEVTNQVVCDRFRFHPRSVCPRDLPSPSFTSPPPN